MTNKQFYQEAAVEVAKGNIDTALWIKVVADMPTAAKAQQQAKYIQLRARELAIQGAKTWAAAGGAPLLKRIFVATFSVLISLAVVVSIAMVVIKLFD